MAANVSIVAMLVSDLRRLITLALDAPIQLAARRDSPHSVIAEI